VTRIHFADDAHLIDLEWTEDEQAKLKTLVERYTSRDVSGALMVHRWQLSCFSLVLGDTEERNDISGQWYDEWPLDDWVDSPIFLSLRETFLPMLVREPRKYPEPEQDNESREALFPEQDRCKNAHHSASPPQKAVLFYPLPDQVGHLKWLLTTIFADNVDIFQMYAEMGNDESTEMVLKFQESRNPAVFVTTPKVGGSSLYLTAANHAVRTEKFWVLMRSGRHMHELSGLGKTEYHIDGFSIRVLVTMRTARGISIYSLELRI
jgi:hypothetical protein